MTFNEGALPTFVIVGAMRSGTTSLYKHLKGHPEVCFSERKELHFFDQEWPLGVDWYRAQFAHHRGETAVGECSPSYMQLSVARARMSRVLPDAQLLAILRDPVERAYSHYWYMRSRGVEALSFEDALRAEPDRVAAGGDEARTRLGYVDKGLYVDHLEALCELYPREQLLVLCTEDLAVDRVGSYASVCRHLGISDEEMPSEWGMAEHQHRGHRSDVLARVGRRAGGTTKRILHRVNTRGGVPYPPMAPAVRRDLTARFAEPNERLGRWLGRPLPWEVAAGG